MELADDLTDSHPLRSPLPDRGHRGDLGQGPSCRAGAGYPAIGRPPAPGSLTWGRSESPSRTAIVFPPHPIFN